MKEGLCGSLLRPQKCRFKHYRGLFVPLCGLVRSLCLSVVHECVYNTGCTVTVIILYLLVSSVRFRRRNAV